MVGQIRFLIFIFTGLLMHFLPLKGQNIVEEYCATTVSEADFAQLRQDAIGIASASLRTTGLEDRKVLAATIHIVRRSNGTGGLSPEEIEVQMSIANSLLRYSGVEFYIREVNFINSDVYFNFSKASEAPMGSQHDRINTLNIYFVNTISLGSFGATACGYAYLPTNGPDRMVLRNDCAINGSTLVHEIGHFLGLIHTHGPSNNINATLELVNGSNCSTEGDLVCDTPADPLLGTSNVTEDCNYVGVSRDRNGQFFRPNVRNLMSYSRVVCRDDFSEGQYQRMAESYQMYRTNILLKPVIADFDIQSQEICAGNSISFSQNATGAVSYSWSFPGGTPSTSTQQNPTIVYNSPGEYLATLTVTSGEGLTDTYTSIQHIKVKPAVTAQISTAENFSSPTAIDGMVESENFAQSFQLNPSVSLTGGRSAFVPLFGNQASENIERLNSKVWKTTEGGEYLLQFDYAYKKFPGKQDVFSIYNESYCRNENRTLLWSASDDELSNGVSSTELFIPTQGDWIQKGIFFNLPPVDNSYNLAFEVISGGGNNFYLDNYKIRKRKPLDADSLVLLEFYHAMNDVLPWNLRDRVDQWTGVEIQEGRVVGLNFENLGLELNLNFSLAGLTELTHINFSGNQLEILPAFLNLPSLTSLVLENVTIGELPSNWSGVSNLEVLSIANNNLVTLPNGIFSLPSLKKFNAGNNKMVTIPTTPFTSSEIEILDFRGNSLRNAPRVSSQAEDQSVNISVNFQSFLSLSNIPVDQRSKYLYAPQKLIGQNSYKYPEPTETVNITCPAADDLSSTEVKWYKNNQEVLEFESQKTITISGDEENYAYYQCRTTNENFPDLELNSAITFLHWDQPSICDQGIAGTYQVTTQGTLGGGANFNVSKSIEVVAVQPSQYTVTDISGGTAEISNPGLEVPVTVTYDCGMIRLGIEEESDYNIFRSQFDATNGNFTLYWRSRLGDEGVSEYELIEPGLSNKTEMLTFNIDIQVGQTKVDRPNRTFEVVIGCVEGSPPPVFTLSDGATAFLNEQQQTSGVTEPGTAAPFVYTVVAEDGVHTSDWTVTFDETPRILTTTNTASPQTNCSAPNGSAQITSINVNGNPFSLDDEIFRIEWFAENNLNDPISELFSIDQRIAGRYFYRVTERASGCRSPLTAVMVEDFTLPGNVSIEVLSDDRSCSAIGQSDGVLAVSISETAGAYAIAWYAEGEEMSFSNLPTVTDLSAGNYRVEVTDVSTGCVYEVQATVAPAPSVITGDFTVTPQGDCDAPDGRIDLLSITQDDVIEPINDPRFLIEWSETATFDEIVSTGTIFGNLPSGIYYGRIRDVLLDCQSQVYSFNVGANMIEGVNLIERTNNTQCFSETGNGVLSLNVGGTTDGYAFQWYSGASVSGAVIGTSARLTGLTGGTYTAKITSVSGGNEGCFSTITTSVANEPNTLEATISSTPVTSCIESNGTATVTSLLVNGSLTFLGPNYQIEWSRQINFSNILGTSTTISGLSSGRYYVRVTELSTSCSVLLPSFTIEEDLIDISPAVTAKVNTNCTTSANGALTVTNVAPQSNYSFVWYKDEVHEENIIGTNASVTGLEGGLYSLVVTENTSGCAFTESYEVADQLVYPTLQYKLEPQTSCAAPNGIIQVTSVRAGGSTITNFSNYRFEWSIDANFSQVIGNASVLRDLSEGRYYVRVTNRSTGCTSTTTIVNLPAQLVFPEVSLVSNVSEKQALNQKGSLEIDVDFAGDYEISWFEGKDATGEVIGNSESLTEIAAGEYSVKVSAVLSDGGCSITANYTVRADLRQVQTISFNFPDLWHLDDGPFELNAIASSGLPVSYEVVSGDATIDAGQLLANEVGEVVIRAYNNGTNRYFPAEKIDTLEIEGNFSIQMIMGTEGDEPLSVRQAVLYATTGQVVAESLIKSDTVEIHNVRRGEYFLKIQSLARPDKFFNYYHENQFIWGEANKLRLASDTILFPSILPRKDNLPGSRGTVSGILYNGLEESLIILNALRQGEQPMQNVDLVLLRDGIPIGFTTSDNTGRFTFTGLQEGNYSVMLDKFGVLFDASHITFEVQSVRPTNLTIFVGRNGSSVDLEVVSGAMEEPAGMKVFPNPVNAELTITFDRIEQSKTLDIFSTDGRLILRKEIAEGQAEISFDFSGNKAGLYLLVVTEGGKRFIEKIIKR